MAIRDHHRPAASAASSTGLPAADRLVALETAIAGLTFAEAERLARHFSPSALRRRRLAERDRLVHDLSQYFELAPSGWELARSICSWLLRIATTANQAADPKHDLGRRVLAIGAGRVPSIATVRAILAGRPG